METDHPETRKVNLEIDNKPKFAHLEADILVDEFLDVASDGGVSGDDFSEVELVERGRLASVVQADDHDLVLLRRKKHEPESRHEGPHLRRNTERIAGKRCAIWLIDLGGDKESK